MKKIHYICHYQDISGKRDLVTQPSGITKINYIKSVLKRNGFYVSVFSVAEATTDKNVNYPSFTIKIDENEEITYIHSIGRSNIFLKMISRVWMQIQLLFYLLLKVKSNDRVLVYHSLVLRWPLIIAKFATKKRIFVEVEELYHAAWNSNAKYIEKEKLYLKKIADGYVLVNDIISKKCGFTKPFVVCYGDYQIVSSQKSNFPDNKLHIVYAGVIGDENTDAFIAADTARFLSKKYHIHILGYGLKCTITKIKQHIASINKDLGYQNVTYDGCLSGDSYYDFLSKCRIGLCTRVLEDSLSDYTFPSKVMVYLGNNLIPVCSPISSVVNSSVNDYIIFTKNVTPESIAESISSITNFEENSIETKLVELDNSFKKELIRLFS